MTVRTYLPALDDDPPARHADSPPDFDPIPRKLDTSDGWTAARQRGFIAALARCGSVRVACEAVNMSYSNVHRLRQLPGADSFCHAWDAAIEQATGRIREQLIDHAINGTPETVVTPGGKKVKRRRFNHRTMMWLLQHHRPDQYGDGYRSTFGRGRQPKPWEVLPPIEQVQAEILRKLAAIRRPKMIAIACDPEKRAAWDLLHPDEDQDWDALAAEGARWAGTDRGAD